MNTLIHRLHIGAMASLAGICALGAAPAEASARYDYTGQNYSYQYPSNGCLTTAMHLTMSVVLSDKLAPNLSNQSVTAKSWAIQDGRHGFKDSEAKANVPLHMQVSTDGGGNITAWSVDSYDYLHHDGIHLQYTTHSNQSGDYSADYKCQPSAVGSNFVTGTWSAK